MSESKGYEDYGVDIGDEIDPFAPGNVEKVTLIVNMRIYDALMALLSIKDPEVAARLNEVHESGGIVGSLPFLDLRQQ